MQTELKELDIPLVFVTAEKRKDIVPSIVEFIKTNNSSHVFANFEYEVDELRRDTKVLEQLSNNDNKEVQFNLYHDQVIVEPGSITNTTGKPMKVFTPYHKTWLSTIKKDPSLLDTLPPPSKPSNPLPITSIKNASPSIPPVPQSKQFSSTADRDRIRSLWPAGHTAGLSRLRSFINNKIEDYATTRSDPSKDSSSRMSAYFSSGSVSVREALSAIRQYNSGSADFSTQGASPGIAAWVREICFREMYRQMMVVLPHNSLNLPQNLKFTFVEWEDDEEGWEKWKTGQTGVPFIDAGMRQLNTEAYMHNRLRMNVSSYLYCNLLIDYRRGERYFAEQLIDWDLCNNTQGWEPSYTVFNPVSQAERNDPEGEYIRKWVPELRSVQGKAVFAPWERLGREEFERLGYSEPHVDWRETKERCLGRFKRDMGGVEV